MSPTPPRRPIAPTPPRRPLTTPWLGLFIALLAVHGCARNEAYRTATTAQCLPAQPTENAQSLYEVHDGFDLGFVEFSERGNAHDSARVERVLGHIRDRAEGRPLAGGCEGHKGDEGDNHRGLVLVVFVHGWNHNAAPDDSNVISFRNTLHQLSALRAAHTGTADRRRLVGLYVGWRGRSLVLPGLQMATFWDRKAVAEEVARGGITDLLLQLDRIDKAEPTNVMVTFGHSFGGAIVLSALAEPLLERLIALPPRSAHGRCLDTAAGPSLRGVGDGVLLLNPAIEANRALHLFERARSRCYADNQAPLLISLSSDADWATHYAFTAGQALGRLLFSRQADIAHSAYVDRRDGTPLVLKEEHMDSNTVGNFAAYLTHRIAFSPGRPSGRDGARSRACAAADNAALNYRPCAEDIEGCRARGLTRTPSHASLGDLPANFPLYFIKTNRAFIGGHNDIFNDQVRALSYSLIDATVRQGLIDQTAAERTYAPATPAALLHEPTKLEQRFAHFYRQTACAEP